MRNGRFNAGDVTTSTQLPAVLAEVGFYLLPIVMAVWIL